MQDRLFHTKKTLNCGGKILDVSSPVVMGILNLTPDSFYDGGKFIQEKSIIEQTQLMLSEGASIIDVGAVSSRPGAADVSEEEEQKRLIPAIKMLADHFPDAVFSVDTFRSGIARKAIEAGASVINDISAGEMDTEMFETVASLKVPYVLMHMQGTPKTMQENPVYENVVDEVLNFFLKKMEQLYEQNVYDIILDPGFGFGKTVDHNYRLLKGIEVFKFTGLPIMAGISRKSMVCKVLKVNPADALNGTTSVNTIALMNGADILRVHDVKEARECIELYKAYEKNSDENELF